MSGDSILPNLYLEVSGWLFRDVVCAFSDGRDDSDGVVRMVLSLRESFETVENPFVDGVAPLLEKVDTGVATIVLMVVDSNDDCVSFGVEYARGKYFWSRGVWR